MSILLDIYHHFARFTPHHKSRDEVLAAMASDRQATTGEKLEWQTSVVDRQKLLKIADEDTTFSKRKSMAAYYGIDGYKGTEAQNAKLMDAITDDMIG